MSGEGLGLIKTEYYFPVEEDERFAKHIYYLRQNRSNMQGIGQSEIFVSIGIFE